MQYIIINILSIWVIWKKSELKNEKHVAFGNNLSCKTSMYNMYIYTYKLNLEGIQYDIIDASSFMLHAILTEDCV